jgi:hypothetical protein
MFAFISLAATLAVQAAAPAPRIDASVVAAAIQPKLPQRFSPEVAMVGAVAEGDLLILTFEVPEVMLIGATPEGVSARFSQGFCAPEAGRLLLRGAMSLRVDARTPGAGRAVRGAVLESCPLAAATDGPLPPPPPRR